MTTRIETDVDARRSTVYLSEAPTSPVANFTCPLGHSFAAVLDSADPDADIWAVAACPTCRWEMWLRREPGETS